MVVDGEELEQVSSFNSLGPVIYEDSNCSDEVKKKDWDSQNSLPKSYQDLERCTAVGEMIRCVCWVQNTILKYAGAISEEFKDLYRRLDQARFSPPLEDSRFHYGFNSTYLRQVVSYWRDRFDWNKQVDILNKYPHFKTQIEGFDSLAAARIFYKLMQRLGFEEFYLQGGDWGGLICTNIAQMIPEKVKGLHLNFFPITKGGLKMLIALILGPYLPFLVGFTKEDVKRTFPFFEKNLYEMLRETGYMHIQGTKPDSAGCGLNDSPVGLAAYILEKFSTWTDKEFRDLEDGGLERKFSLDDLLTNVMIYWVTGTIVSSMRLYKENLNRNLDKRPDAKITVYAPNWNNCIPQ
nr:PREDICTED: epoxide hydrolase 1-like [Latimeria chalumnae]|eukprot:XP_014352739.1 PREDICTED: epoxide hydrolase 1-like [Latimeria chalumnae]